MKSSVFLSKEFSDYLIKNRFINNNADGLEISNEKLNFQKILQIILKSHLNFDYTTEEVLDIIKKNEDPIKTTWLKKIIKTEFDISYNQKIDYSIPNAIFFEGDIDCSHNSSKRNIMSKGSNYSFKNEFFKSPLRTVFDIKMDSKDITNIYHECKNIVLIDPYIFAHDFKKERSLVNFLDTCFNFKNKTVNKKLTIVTVFPTGFRDRVNNNTINKYILNLSNKLNMDKSKISILRHLDENEFRSNRHLITDYALMDLQHIFDRDDGVVSGLYLYNNDVGKNFSQANELIDKIRNLNNETTEKHTKAQDDSLKQSNFKFGDILNNPLFN